MSGAEAPGPAPYVGHYYLRIQGGAFIALKSFAGCFDKVLGVEYEDCFFEAEGLPRELLEWFTDSVSGSHPRRGAEVLQVDPVNGAVLSGLEIVDGFLRAFAVSDFDAASSDYGTLSFVVVPAGLHPIPGGSMLAPPGVTRFRKANFRIEIEGVDCRNVAAVRGLAVSMEKLALPLIGARRRYTPGLPQFGSISVAVAARDSAVQQFQEWVDRAADGIEDLRTAPIEILSADLGTVLRTIGLFDLYPVSFDPFPTSVNLRLVGLSVGRFEIR